MVPSREIARWMLNHLAIAAAACAALLAARDVARAEFTQLQEPFEQQDIITGFPNDGHFGPTGMAFYKNGDILVADAFDDNLYRFPPGGGSVGEPFARGGKALGLVFAGDGKLYAAQRSPAQVVELSPDSGERVRTVASGFSSLISGLAVDPNSTDIFVTDQAANSYSPSPGVFRVRPSDGTVTTYANGDLFPAPDGLVFDADGVLYVANEREGGDIVRVDRDGKASVLVTLPGGPDGLAVGKAGGSLAGSLIVNRNDGVISRVDLTRPPVSVSTFASGGTRGDFVAVSPDGFLFATQTDRIVKFSPASFEVPVGGTGSDLPLKVYLGIVSAVVLGGSAIGFVFWMRQQRLRRTQLAVTASNPTEVEIPGVTVQPPAAQGVVGARATGRLIEHRRDRTTVRHEIGDGSATIGSGSQCSIRVPAAPDVALYHARIWYRNGRYALRHTADAARATLVGGKRIDWVWLEPGDEIRIGTNRFTFES